MEKYLDCALSPRERAEDLLERLSLEEKMAQTVGIFLNARLTDADKEACRYGIGAVSTLDARIMESTEAVAAAQREYQTYIMERSPHHIPAIFHMEGLCGAFIQGSTSFPSGIGRGASFDPELEEQVGRIVARQERCLGISQTLAPLLDIGRDSRLGRQGETYGEDPTLAAAMGTAYTRGAQEGETQGLHTDCVAKHFIGFHNSEAGIHGAASNTPKRMLREIYGKPFQAAISEAQLRGVMPCYCSLDGDAASVSHELLTGLLREDMGFNGLVVSDYSAISNVHKVQHMYESFAETGYRAMEAGMDMELPKKECFNDELMAWFRTGKVPMEVLDTAVLRILESKFRMGLFERPFALNGEALYRNFHNSKDREVSRRSAEESLVLLKNDGILPLRKDCKKIVVIGPHADNPRSFFGGYTHMSMAEAVKAVANSLAGIGEKANNQGKSVRLVPGTQIQSDEGSEFEEILRRVCPDCKSLYRELKERLPDTQVVYAYGYPIAGNDTSRMEEALEAMADADVCILTLGGKHGSCSVASMGEGVDATNINLPECQEVMLRLAAKQGIPLVGVHFNGRAISSDTADETLNAIIEAWNPSEMGAEAICNVLLGDASPSGRLPVTVAYTAAQEPLYYNHPNGSAWHQGESIGFANYVDMPHTPRYSFGYGLSYTTFAYTDLRLSSHQAAPDGTVKVSLTVRNTGDRTGTEVVQLYLRDCYASMVRPCMELAGFRRITLAPGEEKTVCFDFHASQTAFLNREYRWIVEEGDVELMVGASSADIRLRDKIRITASKEMDEKKRVFWA